MKLLVLALLILYDSMLIFQLEHVKALDTMAPYVWESGDFRAMRLGRDAAGRPFLDYEELAMAMLTENFDLTGKKLSGEPLFFPVRRQKEFERLSDAYRMVFADLSCFPVPESAGGDIRDVVYENGWMEERSFDGPRTHEGCDLMAGAPEAGLYPVVSMTDGVVEQAGWLKKGGWRISVLRPPGLLWKDPGRPGVEAGGYSPCRRASGLYGGFRLRRAWDHRPVSSPPPPGDLHPDGAS